MELILKQEIFYSNKDPIPMQEVAESLIALEEIIQQSKEVLSAIFPDVSIKNIDAYIKEIESGSLKEEIIIRLIFGNQEQFEAFLTEAHKLTGMDVLMQEYGFLSVAIAALVLAGGVYALGRLGRARKAEDRRTIVKGSYNNIIQVGANMTGRTPEEVADAITSAISNQKTHAQNAALVIAPAKRDSRAGIFFGKNKDVVIDKETIAALPSKHENIDDEDSIVDLDDIEIEIRAIDLDSLKKGWAGVAPAIHDKRVPLHISPTISSDEVLKSNPLRANVTVIYRERPKDGKKIPRNIIINEILDSDAE